MFSPRETRGPRAVTFASLKQAERCWSYEVCISHHQPTWNLVLKETDNFLPKVLDDKIVEIYFCQGIFISCMGVWKSYFTIPKPFFTKNKSSVLQCQREHGVHCQSDLAVASTYFLVSLVLGATCVNQAAVAGAAPGWKRFGKV